jgi:hypothetical protein
MHVSYIQLCTELNFKKIFNILMILLKRLTGQAGNRLSFKKIGVGWILGFIISVRISVEMKISFHISHDFRGYFCTWVLT